MSAATLAELTEPTVTALRAGLGVLMPAHILDEVPEHQYGPVMALQLQLQAAGAPGPALAVDLPNLGLVAVTAPEAFAAAGGDLDAPARLLRVLHAATDPYVRSAR